MLACGEPVEVVPPDDPAGGVVVGWAVVVTGTDAVVIVPSCEVARFPAESPEPTRKW